jgi:hypothetical protein
MSTLNEMAEIARPLTHPRPGPAVKGSPGSPDYIAYTSKRPGYAHCIHEGVCGDSVTVEDIQKLVYDPYFGGRAAWISTGKTVEGYRLWAATEHTD